MKVIHQNDQVAMRDIPCLSIDVFRETVIQTVAGGGRIASLFGWRGLDSRQVRLFAALATGQGGLGLLVAEVSGSYPAITPDCPQAHRFEREIYEQVGVLPQGHPWLKPIRLLPGDMGERGFLRVEGEEVHEVAVGPIHAGVIEPGHFRFQCHGEQVMNLEISLGYQHRGIEPAMIGGPHKRTLHQMETLAGDTTLGHATAYAMVLEALGGTQPTARAEVLRAIALELERLANHTGDLGAISGDVGYLPTASCCGRTRGLFLNLTAMLCGSRFGRGIIRPGGVGFDLEDSRAMGLASQLKMALRDTQRAVDLLWRTPSVMARLEGTGIISQDTCKRLGLVGPTARACGLEQDVRCDAPFGIYRFNQIPVSTWRTGDVFARAQVRWLEIQRSVAFVLDQLKTLPGGEIQKPLGSLACEAAAVSWVEGWRGEICHVAITDPQGCFEAYKIVDPSFHNWSALEMAMRGQEISDFPLCNKSFNLSYCGHDL